MLTRYQSAIIVVILIISYHHLEKLDIQFNVWLTGDALTTIKHPALVFQK
jgi:hypothetical protein